MIGIYIDIYHLVGGWKTPMFDYCILVSVFSYVFSMFLFSRVLRVYCARVKLAHGCALGRNAVTQAALLVNALSSVANFSLELLLCITHPLLHSLEI